MKISRTFFLSTIIVLLGTFLAPIAAQAAGTDGTKDTAFVNNINAASLGLSEVTSMGVQSTGKIVIAGTSGSGGGYLLRLNSDGTKDTSFPTTRIGTTTSSDDRAGGLQILSDDSFYLAGYFQSITQNSVTTTSPLVAKFDASGTLDTTWATAVNDSSTGLPAYFNVAGSTLESLAVDSTGRLIIGGSIRGRYAAPFSPRYQYPWARLSAAGAVDTSYVSPLTYDYASTYSLTLGDNNSIFAVGFFGSSASRIYKVLSDGTVANGTTFNPPSGYSTNTFRLDSVAMQSDQKILFGGTDYGATAATTDNVAFITRVNADGTQDNTFIAPTLSKLSGTGYPTVYSILPKADGKIVLSGNDFGFVAGLSDTGAIDTSFGTNIASAGLNGTVSRLAYTSTFELLAGGGFTTPSSKVIQFVNAPTYTVTYQHGTGATGNDLVQTITQGSALTLPSPIACPLSATDPCFTGPSGTRQNGWQVTAGSISGGGTYPMTGSSITPTSNVTLTARWTGGPVQFSTTSFLTTPSPMSSIAFPNTVVGSNNQVTIYAYNSGSLATSISNETVGGSGVSRQGGSCNASGGTINAGAQCTIILQWNPGSAGALSSGQYQMQVSGGYFDSVTLTGSAATNKTVTFNNGGGSGTMANQVSAFATNLNNLTYTRLGYSFLYWSLFSDGSGSHYNNQASYPFSADQTLFAQWAADSHVVIYNTQGGSAVSNGAFYTGATVTLPAAPTKSGYIFDGWFTAASGGTAITSPYSPGVITDITLYAQWSVDPNGSSSSGLPHTGSDVMSLLDYSGALIASGVLLLVVAAIRRRKA